MAETLKEKTAKGLFWGALNNGMQQLLGMVFGIVLGRLLSPDDYGMIAMITIFTAIAASLQNSGFSVALANLQHPTHRDYNAVFWFNIIVGALLYVILFFSAPLIASYYHEPRLVPLCRYLFTAFFVSCFCTAQNAYLFKNLKAKQQAKGSILAVLVSSSVGVVMAWQGFAYWSLATQSLVYVTVCTIMAWHYSDWRPTLEWDFRPIRHMFGFSSKVLVTGIVTQVNNNVLNILLGHYFSAHATGCYNQASQWNTKCFSVTQSMVSQVAQPVLVAIGDEKGRQLAALRKMMRFTAFISFPLMFGLALVSHEFIVITITEKWLPSARLLQILAVGGAVMPLSTLLSNSVLSKGRSDMNLWVTVALGLTEIVTMVLIWPYGIELMVVAYAVINVVWLFIWQRCAAHLTGYGLVTFLADTVPFALIAAAVMLATHFATVSLSSLPLLLAARVAMAAVLYYAVMKVAHAQILRECEDFVMRKIRKH